MNLPIIRQPLPPRYSEEDPGSRHGGTDAESALRGRTVPPELSYLLDVEEVRIFQHLDRYEALMMTTLLERQNKYYICNRDEKFFYFAKELNDKPSCSKLYAHSRPMTIDITDDYGKHVMKLERPLRCRTCCGCVCCCLQHLEIQYPPGIPFAYVNERSNINLQKGTRSHINKSITAHPEAHSDKHVSATETRWSIWRGELTITDVAKRKIFSFVGSWFGCRYGTNNSIIVKNAAGKKVGKLTKKMDTCMEVCGMIGDFQIQFDPELSPFEKMIILGASFLADILYFEIRV